MSETGCGSVDGRSGQGDPFMIDRPRYQLDDMPTFTGAFQAGSNVRGGTTARASGAAIPNENWLHNMRCSRPKV